MKRLSLAVVAVASWLLAEMSALTSPKIRVDACDMCDVDNSQRSPRAVFGVLINHSAIRGKHSLSHASPEIRLSFDAILARVQRAIQLPVTLRYWKMIRIAQLTPFSAFQ